MNGRGHAHVVVLTGVPIVIRHIECVQSITYTRAL